MMSEDFLIVLTLQSKPYMCQLGSTHSSPFQALNTKVSDSIESENTFIIHVFPYFFIFKITDILDKPFFYSSPSSYVP